MRLLVMPSRDTIILTAVFVFALAARLPLRRNEAAVAACWRAVNMAEAVRAGDHSRRPTHGDSNVDRTLMGRVVMSTDLVVISSSEVVSTVSTTIWGPSTGMDIPTDGMDIRMGIGRPYDYSSNVAGDVKTEITPKQTEVYRMVTTGCRDDFDGLFQGLSTSVGGHAVTLHSKAIEPSARKHLRAARLDLQN